MALSSTNLNAKSLDVQCILDVPCSRKKRTKDNLCMQTDLYIGFSLSKYIDVVENCAKNLVCGHASHLLRRHKYALLHVGICG